MKKKKKGGTDIGPDWIGSADAASQ